MIYLDQELQRRLGILAHVLDQVDGLNSGGCGLVAWNTAKHLKQWGVDAVVGCLKADKTTNPKLLQGVSLVSRTADDLYHETQWTCAHAVVCIDNTWGWDSTGLRSIDSKNWACYGPLEEGFIPVKGTSKMFNAPDGWNRYFNWHRDKPKVRRVIKYVLDKHNDNVSYFTAGQVYRYGEFY